MRPNNLLMLFIFIFVACSLFAQGTTVTIGTGNSGQRQPFGVYYGYERDASLYLSAEIGQTGFINALRWQVLDALSTNVPYQIYLKNVSQTTLTATTWDNMISGATLVKTGTMMFNTAGFQNMQLDTNFYHDGQNLLVLVATSYGGAGTGAYPVFAYTEYGTNRHEVWATDDTPPSGLGTLNVFRPNLQIFFPPEATEPVFGVSPSYVNFGSVPINSTNFRTVTISNQGGGTLVINTVTLSGGASYALIGAPVSGVSLSMGQSTSFEVRYTPTAPSAADYGTIYVYDNGPVAHEVSINGSAYDPEVHTFPYTESFDGTTFPPYGWATQPLTGTTAFARIVSGSNPAVTTHSGMAMTMFDSFNASIGNTAILVTPPLDVTDPNYENMFRFWMYRDSGLPEAYDKIDVYMNTAPNLVGSPQLMHTIYRCKSLSPAETGPDGWYQYFVSPPVIGYSPVYFILKATGDYGYNMFLDDVSFERNPILQLPNPAVLVSPADGVSGIDLQPTLEWSPNSIGTTNGYRLSFGTDNPPTNMMYQYDTYDDTSYPITAPLDQLSTYYWQVTPYNTNGLALDCPVWSFTTLAATSAFTYSPSTMDFGFVPMGATIGSYVNLGNQGPSPSILTVTNVSLAGDSDFTFDYLYGPPPYELGVGANGDFLQVFFSPSSQGPKNAILSITENTSGVAHEIPITGMGMIGSMPPNSATIVQPENYATDVTWMSPTLEWQPGAGAPPTGYVVYFGTDNPPLTLLYSQTETSNITPTLEYNTTYYWQIVPFNPDGSANDCPVWTFTTGSPGYEITPTDYDFGYVALDVTSTVYYYIQNNGIGNLRIDNISLSGSPAFSLPPDFDASHDFPYYLDAGTSLQIGISFSPTSTDSLYACNLNVLEATSMYAHTYYITGRGSGYAEVSVTPNPFDFDNVRIGETVIQTFTVSNNGSAGTTVTDIMINPLGDPGYNLASVPTLPYALSAGGSFTFDVAFEPDTVDFLTSSIFITNSLNTDTTFVALQGTGIPADEIPFYPWSETFDDMVLPGWEMPYGNWALGGNYSGGTAIQTTVNNRLITPQLFMENNLMAFSIKWSHQYFENLAYHDYNDDTLSVYYSINNDTWQPIWSIAGKAYDGAVLESSPMNTITKYRIPASLYNQYVRFSINTGFEREGYIPASIDSFCVYTEDYPWPTPIGFVSPEPGELGVPLSKDFSWYNGDFTEGTQFHFGTSPSTLNLIYTGEVINNLHNIHTAPMVDGMANIDLGLDLQPNTTYYWQVSSITYGVGQIESPIFNFTTLSSNPVIAAVPDSISMYVDFSPSIVDNSIRLYNNGSSNLIITAYDYPDLPFTITSEDTLPKTILPGGHTTCYWGMSSEVAGTWNDTFYVHSNDPATPILAIPLNFTMAAVPYMYAEPNPLYIEAQETDTGTGTFTIYNNGTAPLTFSRGAATSAWIDFTPLSGSVPSHDSLQINVNAHSVSIAAGLILGDIFLSTNDPQHPNYHMEVQFNVIAAPMVVDFYAMPLSGHAPLTVQFTDDSHFGPQMPNSTVTSWRWDFQTDGTVDSYEQNPTYTFTTIGQFDVTLSVVTNTGLINSVMKHHYIETENQPPQATLPIAPVTILEDQSTEIINMLSHFDDPDDDSMTFTVYPSPNFSMLINGPDLQFTPVSDWYGEETFTITATDNYGGSASQTITITVTPVNDAPMFDMNHYQYFIRNSHFTLNFANLVDDVDNPDSELTLQITNVDIPPQINVSYSPGVPGALTATFFAPGNWTGSNNFHITVNDNTGRAIAHVYPVFVVLENFTATFHTNLSAGAAPTGLTGQVVEFFDDTLGNVDQWSWNFGDNTPVATDQNPTHIYTNPGTYPVTLTVTNIETGSTDDYTTSITMVGTAVGGTIDGIVNWEYEVINLLPGTIIDSTAIINMPDGGTINILDSTAVYIYGEFNAEGVTFQGHSGNGWSGFYFGNGQTRNTSEFTDCEFLDAENPITIDGCDVTINGCTFAPSDTTQFIDGTGIKIVGSASPNLNGLYFQNYNNGIEFEGDNARTLTTPTLTNIRVRNSESSTRDGVDTYGITFNGEVDANLNGITVENYTQGLVFTNGATRTLTTPTLTNIRVRNSQNSTRGDTKGIVFSGSVCPTILETEPDSVTVGGYNTGIEFNDGTYNTTQTPTLTNIRVRNSSSSTRSTDVGIAVNSTNLLNITGSDIDGYSTGLKIINDGTRTLSTPTLTNIRVRNSQNSSRLGTTGILLSGDINPQFRELDIEDYATGIRFDGTGNASRTITTPTLTNIRVRNSENSSRILSTGISVDNVDKITIIGGEITDNTTGIEILNSDQTRTISTPTLTNIRVRNSENSTRDESIGILLGSGVAGRLTLSTIAEAAVGILVADGNRTVLKDNLVKNCITGIRAVGTTVPLPLKCNNFKLESAYQALYPGVQFQAIELLNLGPWSVRNNSMWGYPVAVKAVNADFLFQNNIVWATTPLSTPFVYVGQPISLITYNDIAYVSGFPGIGNINTNPMFADIANDDFHLTFNSPCIDAGNPLLPHDEDGSVCDMGTYTYLHKASFTVDAMFITPNTMVSFTNTSLGHPNPGSTIAWDLNNDGQVESTSWNWSHTFTQPGQYDLKLTVSTGILEDEVVVLRTVIVQDDQLAPPGNFRIALESNDIHLDWSPVSHYLNGLPANVQYYLIYRNDKPGGNFTYVGNTENGQNSFTIPGGASYKRQFFLVIGFTGTRDELNRYIEQNRIFHKDNQTSDAIK